MLHAGWYLVAFEDELVQDLTPVRIGDRRLMLVRDGGGVRMFDATCPHRGANLAYGGDLRGDLVVCPFHGRRIGLGECRSGAGSGLSVRGYPTMTLGSMVLARLTDTPDGEVQAAATLSGLLAGRDVHRAVVAQVRVPVEYVVENAFDAEHFSTVHGVPEVRGMTARPHPDGYLTIGGEFFTVQNPWGDERVRDYVRTTLGERARLQADASSGFYASAFSPTLVATVFGAGDDASVIITGALPTPGGCEVRVAVASRPGPHVARVVQGARTAIEQDVEVWEHLDPEAPCSLDEQDAPVLAFQEFCRSFPRAAPVGLQLPEAVG